MTEWIDVKDRLPEPNIDVLAWVTSIEKTFFEAGEKYAAIERFCLWSDGVDPSFRSDRFYPAKVTHWQPLPEAPKEDDFKLPKSCNTKNLEECDSCQ